MASCIVRRYPSLAIPYNQAICLGIVFLFVFAAFLTLQAFSSKLYGEILASDVTVSLYFAFTIASVFIPPVTTKLGPIPALLLGICGYVALVATSLLRELFPSHVGRRAVVSAGAVNGIGSALLWNAQGTLILGYAERGVDGGGIFAVFWGFFNASAILGGAASFLTFGEETGATVVLSIFLGFLAVAAVAAWVLLVPPVATAGGGGPREEIAGTLSLFGAGRTRNLLPLFFYTGFKQAYQIVTFGDRFFGARALGIEVLLFYVADMLGGVVAGKLLDGECRPKREGYEGIPPAAPDHRGAAKRCVLLFSLVNVVACLCALPRELACPGPSCRVDLSLADPAVILPSLAYVSWGFVDGVAQTYCYWLMGLFYEGLADQSRVIGFFTCVQSAGWCLGFWLVPLERMSAMAQLFSTFVSFLLGTAFALRELP